MIPQKQIMYNNLQLIYMCYNKSGFVRLLLAEIDCLFSSLIAKNSSADLSRQLKKRYLIDVIA